jgi:HTH-like domain
MCEWLEVSKSGYYEWRSRPQSETEKRREILKLKIKALFGANNEEYGYRRLHAALARGGEQAGEELVRQLMRELELNEAISDLQITRKTLIALAAQHENQPAAEPAGPSPALPDHPACQQILDAFADLRRPLRARDLCQALDLPIVSKNNENIRSKLKRLVSRGILIETEPGLFAQPHP